jgi:sugar lactone lactonase YvrE
VTALAAFALALLLAAPVQAAPTHVRREALDVTGLNHACGAAVDSKGDLYLSSAGESKVNVYDPSHNFLTSIADSNTPCGLAVTSTGILYVSEKATGEVVRFKPNKYPFEGTPTYGSREVVDASGKAKGIAVDPFDNRLYVAEGNRVSAYDAEGTLGINEVQRVLLFEVTGGTFKLKFGGQETGTLPFSASAEEVKAALEALSSIGAGNISVERPKEKEFFITFTGALGHTDVEAIVGDPSGLTGGVPQVLVEEQAKGWNGHIGEGVLSEASGVAPYTAEPAEGSGSPIDRYLAVADAAGIAADRLYLFSGQDIRSLKLRRELTGSATPDGSFGFGAAGAYLTADPGTVKAKKCATVGEEACTAGHFYLYDAAHKALDEFDGSGEYLDQAKNAAFADAEPTAIAVDRSGGANDGTVYVTAGAGTGATALAFRPLLQPAREALAEPISHTLPGVRAVATDANGNVYATGGSKVSIYGPKGNEVTSFEDPGGPRDLAVDSKCNVYVMDGETTVTYYKPSACPPKSGTTYERHEPAIAKGSEFPSGSKTLKAIAVNPGPAAGNDHLFVTAGKVTREYDSAEKGSKLLNPEFGTVISSTRQSIAVNGANGNVYIAILGHLIYVLNPAGTEILARIDTTVSTTGATGANPFIAVDQSNGHAIEFDGAKKSAREYDPVANGFVAEFGNFTEGLTVLYRLAVDNSCAIKGLTGKTCEEFDPANGNVYVAFADTSPTHPPFEGINAFGPLKYKEPPAPKKFKLTVTKAGTGSGTVTSQPEGISCGTGCTEFEEGVKVTLEVKASEGSKFLSWSGSGCSGTGACKVTMSEDREVTAEFEGPPPTEKLEVIIEPPGSGKVTSTPPGIKCPATCSAEYGENVEVALTAEATKGFKFVKWKGCDSEAESGDCLVKMDKAHEVKAIFTVATYPLTVIKKGNGEGTVTSNPAGINCGSQCTHEYEFGKEVKLSQVTEEGSEFSGWGGACSGKGACEVKVEGPVEVTATFKALAQVTVTQPHPIAYTEATLHGEVQTAELETEYRFEYLTQAQFEEDGESFEGAQHTPEGELAPAKAPVSVQASLSGLQEGTAYRFRLVAASTAGMVEDEGSFATLQRRAFETCPNAQYRTGLSANLPDCRAYELVTPAQTDGLIPYAAGDGGTVSGSFSNWLTVQTGEEAGKLLSYFTDGTLPGFEGSGLADGYQAKRGAGDHPPDGWQSVVVSPNYEQAAGSEPEQHGISPDQLYSIWQTVPVPETFPETLPPGVYLRTPEGFEALGKGSLGTDLGARSRYVSADGAHAIFASQEHLEEKAAPKGTEAIYDRAAGEASAEVVSVKPDGSAFSEGASYLAATEDGATVVFRAGGTLYLHRGGKTTEIATAPNAFAGISEDGTRIFYVATAEGTSSPPPAAPLYACDTEAGPCAGPGAHSPEEISAAGIFALVSPDGSHAFFSSEEAIGEEVNENGEEPEAGAHNLYAWDGAQTRFLAKLAPADFKNEAFAGFPGVNLGAWTHALGFDDHSGRPLAPTRSSADGGVFVFQSHARLSAYDNEGAGEIYRYDPAAEAGERLTCISCDPSGAPPRADALLEDIRIFRSTPVSPKTMIANVSEDGEEVFFQSFDRLLPEDANDVEDVYEWKAKGTGGCSRTGGCLALISSGQGEVPSFLYAMNANGRDVFIQTQEKLVGADVAGSASIYDAREGGGIPEPVEPTQCQGDACQGQGSEPPTLPSPATIGSGEEGEAGPHPKPCAKGKHRVKGRCVAVKHKHRKRRHRAHANRGGSR